MRNVSSRASSNSETDASELLEAHEDMFSQFSMDNYVISWNLWSHTGVLPGLTLPSLHYMITIRRSLTFWFYNESLSCFKVIYDIKLERYFAIHRYSVWIWTNQKLTYTHAIRRHSVEQTFKTFLWFWSRCFRITRTF